jgi:hypothetical protein
MILTIPQFESLDPALGMVFWRAGEKERRLNRRIAWRARKRRVRCAVIWCDDVVRASDETSSFEASSDLLLFRFIFERRGWVGLP